MIVSRPVGNPRIGRNTDERLAQGHDLLHGAGTIMVVDDEEAVRKLATHLLERRGFRVLSAADGTEAIRLYGAHTGAIAAVLLDMNMPHLDGLETLVRLRRIDAGVRVILSSGYTEHHASERFAGHKLAGFVAKPYSEEELLQALHRALNVQQT
jgi:two-component system cell cycle sensor histidine kinase/response regulator CckA